MSKTKIIILSLILAILLMGLIFYMSHQPREDSNSLSKSMAIRVMDVLNKFFPGRDFTLSRVNHLLRKSAHFIVYMILAVVVLNLLVKWGVYGFRVLLYTFIFCVIFAATDEFHQLFVPGRGGQIRDVVLDSLGSLTGIFIATIFRRKRIFRE